MENLFKKTKNFIFEHRLAIILSLLLTIMIFAPMFAFPLVIKNEYKGINENAFGTDAHLYLTRGREVLDGHGLGSPLLREGKDQPDAYLSYSDYILLAPIKLLGLAQKVNIVTLYNIYNFIGVFLLIMLIYYLVWQLSGYKLLSIAAALFAIGGYSIVYHKALFYHDFNIYARVIYPYFSSLILFLYFNFLVKSLKAPKLKYKICASLFFGLLFYVYFYAWTFTLAFSGSLFLIFLFKKDWLSAKKVFFISLAGVLLGSYNLVRLLLSLGTSAGKQTSYFLWLTYGHGPIFSVIGFITLMLFAAYFYKNKEDNNWPFIFALILSGWIALNQQIITGRILQYGHYYFYFIVPLSIIVSLYMVWRLIKNQSWQNYFFIFAIAVVFINTAGGQYKSFFYTFEPKRYEQNFRPIIDALNRDRTLGVILSGQTNEYLFTIFTSHDLFWHTAAAFNQAPIQRLKDALFVYLYLNKEARNNFSGYLETIGDNKAESSIYQAYYRSLEGYWSGYSYYEYNSRINANDQELNKKRPEIISQLNKEYEDAVLKNNGINNLLKKYGVNYIVWDKNNNPEWDLSGIAGLKLLTSYNNIYLFSVAN